MSMGPDLSTEILESLRHGRDSALDPLWVLGRKDKRREVKRPVKMKVKHTCSPVII
jgi:hypothetical protein